MKLDIQINRIYPHDMHFGVFYVEAPQTFTGRLMKVMTSRLVLA